MSILVIVATFLAAGVEWVEALTIVLAVGLFRGWRSAILGTAIAVLALVALVAVFGVAVTSHVSIAAARTVVGVFLLLFGLKWLHKAILRSSGLKSLHDEAQIFESTRKMLVSSSGGAVALDRVGVGTSFGGVFLEGLEVVFIVVALGGLQNVPAASIGAAGSLVVVVAAGIALRRPLTQVPENTMKYVVGIMLTSFGTFFAGEGIGIQWWRGDLSLLPLIVAYGLASLAFVQLLKRPPQLSSLSRAGIVRSIQAAVREVWGLFVDDGALAIVAITVLFGVALFADHFAHQRGLAGVLLVAGILLAIWTGLSGALRESRKARTKAASGGPAAPVPSRERTAEHKAPEEVAIG